MLYPEIIHMMLFSHYLEETGLKGMIGKNLQSNAIELHEITMERKRSKKESKTA